MVGWGTNGREMAAAGFRGTVREGCRWTHRSRPKMQLQRPCRGKPGEGEVEGSGRWTRLLV